MIEPYGTLMADNKQEALERAKALFPHAPGVTVTEIATGIFSVSVPQTQPGRAETMENDTVKDRITIVSDGATLLPGHTAVTRADGQEIMDIRKITIVMELHKATVAILEHLAPHLEISAERKDIYVDASGRKFQLLTEAE